MESSMVVEKGTVSATFRITLEWCSFSDETRDSLMDQDIRTDKEMPLKTTAWLKTTGKWLRYRNPPLAITTMSEYNLHEFHLWDQHRSTRSLTINKEKLYAGEITAYAMAYCYIQKMKDWDKDPICENDFYFWEEWKMAPVCKNGMELDDHPVQYVTDHPAGVSNLIGWHSFGQQGYELNIKAWCHLTKYTPD